MVANVEITGGASDGLMGAIESAVSGVKAAPVTRETPEATDGRKKLVMQWQDEIRADKKYFKETFCRIREDMQYARLGADPEWVAAGNYTVPLINRHINTSVASLYAKNPKAVAKKKRKLRYRVWDGSPETLQAAMEQALLGDPNAAAIIQEVQQAKTEMQMLDRMGQTLEILFDYYTEEGTPTFKEQMKQCVRRAKVCAVAFCEVGYQRVMESDPDITKQIDDTTTQIDLIESKLADMADNVTDENTADAEELRAMLRDLQEKEFILVREGLTFDFPGATSIIPHRKCKQLLGFVGADYVTREFNLTAEQIQQTYKVDVRNNYKVYQNSAETLGEGKGSGHEESRNHDSATGTTTGEAMGKGKNSTACVWRVQSRRTGQVFTMVEGYPDFVEEPHIPALQVDGFYTIFPLVFNAVEDEKEIYPLSDVHYLKDPQNEYNRARQGLREHRVANRPKYFIRAGALEEIEKHNLQNAPAHAVIELAGLDPQTKIEGLIQPYRGVPVDPALYDTNAVVQDIMFGVGSQEANLGPTSGATATESSISEQSRLSTVSSNVDDLDGFLTRIARAAGQIMLANLDTDTVFEVVGPGAVWPELSREEISKQVFLEIKAGSSGRPNKAAELANLERGMPFMIQIGGLNPTTLQKRYADLLDIDPEELIVEGMPSIVALNAIASKQAAAAGGAQPSTGDPASDPNQQGGEGVDNAPGQGRNETEPGGQAAYPTDTQVTPDGISVF